MAGPAIGPTALFVASIPLQYLVAVLTVQRLHDAGLSRWLVLLFLFPIFSIKAPTTAVSSAGFSDFCGFAALKYSILGQLIPHNEWVGRLLKAS
jgi:uncharacterized membrane protein YhaH (DUF805 family)